MAAKASHILRTCKLAEDLEGSSANDT
jgi:hypothetical protein